MLAPENTNFILIGSIAIGVVVILASILFGLVSKAKRGAKGALIFSANGVAGLVFYGAIIAGAASLLLLDRNLSPRSLSSPGW